LAVSVWLFVWYKGTDISVVTPNISQTFFQKSANFNIWERKNPLSGAFCSVVALAYTKISVIWSAMQLLQPPTERSKNLICSAV
jgi:hypothetical protein